jgi:hypothetical protein
VVGAVAVQVYDPSVGLVVVVAMFVLQLNTHTIGSLTPPPFGVSVPVTVNDDPITDAEAVSEVDTGFGRGKGCRAVALLGKY